MSDIFAERTSISYCSTHASGMTLFPVSVSMSDLLICVSCKYGFAINRRQYFLTFYIGPIVLLFQKFLWHALDKVAKRGSSVAKFTLAFTICGSTTALLDTGWPNK